MRTHLFLRIAVHEAGVLPGLVIDGKHLGHAAVPGLVLASQVGPAERDKATPAVSAECGPLPFLAGLTASTPAAS